jgi:hypothetical protein
MAYGGSKGNGNYYRPAFTTIKLEAIWTVRITYARFASKVIKELLKSLASVSKREYKSTGGRVGAGYLAELAFFSIAPTIDEPCSYPDW